MEAHQFFDRECMDEDDPFRRGEEISMRVGSGGAEYELKMNNFHNHITKDIFVLHWTRDAREDKSKYVYQRQEFKGRGFDFPE